MEKLVLKTNVPEVIAVTSIDGELKTSTLGYADQILFQLTDGRSWYIAPFVAGKIKAAGIGAREPFTVCKVETVVGNRRTVSYEVKRAGAGSEPAPIMQSNNDSGLDRSQVVPQSNIAPLPRTNDNGRSIHAVSNGATALAVAVAPTPQPAPIAAPDTSASAIKYAGMAAVDAILAVEAYAQSKGMTDFNFGADNLQRLWVTLYIDARKGGRA